MSSMLCCRQPCCSLLGCGDEAPGATELLGVGWAGARMGSEGTACSPPAQCFGCLPAQPMLGNVLPEFIKHGRERIEQTIKASGSRLCSYAERVAILMDRSRTPDSSAQPTTPTDNINLGPSANPNAKPTDFDFLKVIGKGSFGKVLLAKRKCDGTFYAVKVLHKKTILKKKEQNHIMAERNVLLKNVKHPFLVGLHYSFQTSEKLYFVLDYVNGGELFFHLQRERCFREPRARFYAAEVASAIGYLHSLNIIYRDLKPENILLDCQGHVVLTDFGLCKEGMEEEETTSTFCGTPEYLAPEVLKKQPYDRTVDWWCLGAVLYEMLFGLPPFYSRDVSQMYDNILHKQLQIQGSKTVAACDILHGLLHKDQKRRLGAKTDFLEIKNHVFFSPINWDDLYHKRITPPFNPNVAGPADLRHFDPEFTQEAISASITHTPDLAASSSSASDAFLGFSYAPTEEDF
ncbi:serine/threonine-protein kinase Sgk2-like isoform X1 [Lagopus muta]|uniref:serine/threonine-protein kinase Sgk2-like isoform X1 n=2 Tax=Lagopus muta TaxID=64668 RepID=UPI00209DE42A|nr:serine/threonine-protein kinase Sgk2-like isoform X1 [Lagopus muta]